MGCTQGNFTQQETGDFLQHYAMGPLIGEGSFGQVRAARHKEEKTNRAVKIVDVAKNKGASRSQIKAAWEEERHWRRVGSHENIVELFAVFTSDRYFFMVMERCERSLLDELPTILGEDAASLKVIFRQMARGVAQVHRRRVVHRDVKPSNFLLGGPDGRTVKLCDFGLAATEPKSGDLLGGTFGTTSYMSPEMVGGMGHNRSTDIWSLGATAYVMAFGDFPYRPKSKATSDMKVAILFGVPAPSFGRDLPATHKPPAGVVSFIKAMLQREPFERKTADELLRMPYLSTNSEKDCGRFISTCSTASASSLGLMDRASSTMTWTTDSEAVITTGAVSITHYPSNEVHRVCL